MNIEKFRYEPKRAYHDPATDGKFYNFGLIPQDERTTEQLESDEVSVQAMPKFQIIGTTKYNKDKVCLFDLWKHPEIVKANGFEYPGTHQLTGSCVGAGGGNALFSLAAADAVYRNDFENPLVPFWLLPYGRSRYYLGDRGPGEGSTGATFARALQEDGAPPANSEGLPKFTNTDGLVWGSQVEMKWSNGAAVPSEWAEKAKKNRVRTAAKCNDHNDVREAICNYYPVTIASMWGGMMQCQVTEGVLLSKRVTSWSHQMSIHGWWNHPQLGEIFWIQNQWGLNAHGTCPSGAPPGGFWVKKEEVDWICRNGQEAFAISGWDGYFLAREIEWYV